MSKLEIKLILCPIDFSESSELDRDNDRHHTRIFAPYQAIFAQRLEKVKLAFVSHQSWRGFAFGQCVWPWDQRHQRRCPLSSSERPISSKQR
jgi:hypothetical protein